MKTVKHNIKAEKKQEEVAEDATYYSCERHFGQYSRSMALPFHVDADNARFGYPEVRRGLFPGSGCTQRLPRYINRTYVMELMLMGQQVDAHEAYRMGLVNKVVSLDQLMPTARQWAEIICEAGPLGIRAAKEAIIRGFDMTMEEGIRLESKLLNRVRNTEDFREGARAFIEKRKPNWKAR